LADGDQILDGGPCEVGVESTIIDCTGDAPKILRPGAITAQMISESTGLDVVGQTPDGAVVESNAIRVSGSLEAHYAPVATVVLDQSPVAGQGFIAMADIVAGDGVVRLAAPKTHEEFARVLYSALRAADEQGLETVVVAQPVGDGIEVAIRDRLKRASHIA
jgi:L-threonylcarbamoyladenylate synthase